MILWCKSPENITGNKRKINADDQSLSPFPTMLFFFFLGQIHLSEPHLMPSAMLSKKGLCFCFLTLYHMSQVQTESINFHMPKQM